MESTGFYKDRLPEETLKLIKGKLNDLNIKVSEQWYDSGIKDIYSLRLTIDELNVGVNGKGISEIFAQASAYAELIERLANFILVNPSFYTEFGKLRNHKEFSVKDFFNSSFNFWTTEENAISELNNLYNRGSDTVNCIPVRNILSDEVKYLPSFFIPFFGSNGMGAGNTYYEMAVQSISEIFERYSMKKILMENYDAPLINIEKLKDKFPRITSIKNEIEKHDRTVYIRDCSIGKRLPVYCVVIINNIDNSYTISFGSHPNFEFAIERCFTEALQCANISRLKNFAKSNGKVSYFDLMGIFANGTGAYPLKLFNDNLYSSNTDFYSMTYDSNEQMYNYYLKLIKDNNFDFYYYDNSFLGLSTGQFFSPNVSDIFIPNTDELVTYMNAKKIADSFFEDFDSISIEKKNFFLNVYDFSMRYNLGLKNADFKSDLNLSSSYTLLIYLGIKNIQSDNYDRGIKYLNFAEKNIKGNEVLLTELRHIISDAEKHIKSNSRLMAMKIKQEFPYQSNRKSLFYKLIELKNLKADKEYGI